MEPDNRASLIPDPGEKVEFHPLRTLHGDQIPVFQATVLDVRRVTGLTTLVASSRPIIKDGKARIIRSLNGSVWGGDGEVHWGVWFTVIDLTTGEVTKEHRGEMSTPMRVPKKESED